MDADRNLLFGVLALQGDLIDSGQFAEACTAWAARKDRPLADLLVERGWLSADDRSLIDQLMERKLKKHSGDAHKSLVAAAADAVSVRGAVAAVQNTLHDADVRQSLAGIVPTEREGRGTGTIQYVQTLSHTPETRNRYTLTTMHAKGGIGQVWLARDTELDREVALKELRPEQADNSAVLERFLREAKITGQLDHPGVVPVYEVARGDGTPGAGGRPYYTMRFIAGRTLTDAVADYHRKRVDRTAGRVDLLALIQAFVGVCNTVAYAHSKGVIHRDLKGLNLVLGAFGEVILLDWGLAKLVDQAEAVEPEAAPDFDPAATAAYTGGAGGDGDGDSGLTVAGQALGTPAYMAPEQAEGRLDRIGRQTDVYGLGAVLYEILAGKPPFDGASTREVLRKVSEEAPTRPRRLNPQAPRALEAVCLKAMAKDPHNRYASAAALAADVQHWLADEPVTAWREPWTGRARRWVSRNRTSVAAGVAALAVAAVALSALLISQTRANRALGLALDRESLARTEADAQSDLARQAIESFYSGVTEDVILRRPELEDLRRRLLAAPLGFYERLVALLENEHSVSYRTVGRANVAYALERVAALQAITGRRDDAIRTRRKVVEIYDALPELGPVRAAGQLRELANLQRLAGRPEDSLMSFRESLERFNRLNTDGNQQLDIAKTLSDMGLLQKDLGLTAEARTSLEAARKTFLEVVRENPRSWTVGYLASSATALGNLEVEAGRLNEALTFYEEAVRRYEAQAVGQPKTATYYPAELSRGLNNLGLCLARLGRTDEGRRTLERGRTIREGLLADQPLNIDFRADLARSHYHFAQLELLSGRPTEALDSLNKAQRMYAGIPPKAPEDWYYQACLLALHSQLIVAGKAEADLSQAQRDQSRTDCDAAIARLKDAVTNGFRNLTMMKGDTSLDPLRSRPDFQELLRSLEKSAGR